MVQTIREETRILARIERVTINAASHTSQRTREKGSDDAERLAARCATRRQR
jgi:hypothetical protein